MALENKDDEKIVNLLENQFPMRAIKVDFRDLNNKTLIIKNSFKEAYKVLDDEDKKDRWFYIAKFDNFTYQIVLVGIIAMAINEKDGYLNLYWLETSNVFKNKGYSKEILEYLKSYTKWMHLKGIVVKCTKQEDFSVFKKNGFINKGDNSLLMKWEPES